MRMRVVAPPAPPRAAKLPVTFSGTKNLKICSSHLSENFLQEFYQDSNFHTKMGTQKPAFLERLLKSGKA